MISLKTTEQIDAIARAGSILAALFDAIVPEIRPGVSTADLDLFGENFIMSHAGATPSFKGLYGFPATLCERPGVRARGRHQPTTISSSDAPGE